MTTTTPFSGPDTPTGTGNPSSVVIIEDTYARYSQYSDRARFAWRLNSRSPTAAAGLRGAAVAAGGRQAGRGRRQYGGETPATRPPHPVGRRVVPRRWCRRRQRTLSVRRPRRR